MKNAALSSTVLALLCAITLGCTTSTDGGGAGDIDTDSDADSDTDADTDSDTDTDADSDSDSDSDTETETETESDSVEEGSLETGESCSESYQCAGEAECVSGEYTDAYCAPLCTGAPGDCQNETTGECGMCLDAGEFMFCMYYCGIGGTIAGCTFTAVCPGDMECDGAVCR